MDMNLVRMERYGRERMIEMRNLSKVRPNPVETSRWVDRQADRQIGDGLNGATL